MKQILLSIALFILLGSFSPADEEKHCFIRVTNEFKEAHDGYRKDCNVLVVISDTSGENYVSLNAVNEFPELFDQKQQLFIYWLYPEAFPLSHIDN